MPMLTAVSTITLCARSYQGWEPTSRARIGLKYLVKGTSKFSQPQPNNGRAKNAWKPTPQTIKRFCVVISVGEIVVNLLSVPDDSTQSASLLIIRKITATTSKASIRVREVLA